MLYTHCTAKSEAIKAAVHCSLHRIRLLLHHRPVRKMESAKVFVFLGLAATVSGKGFKYSSCVCRLLLKHFGVPSFGLL